MEREREIDTCVYICIYIYIERERDRERERKEYRRSLLASSLSVSSRSPARVAAVQCAPLVSRGLFRCAHLESTAKYAGKQKPAGMRACVPFVYARLPHTARMHRQRPNTGVAGRMGLRRRRWSSCR